MKNTLKYLFPFLFLALPVCGQQFTIGGKIELDRGCLLVLTQTPEGMDTLSRTAFSGETFSLAGELAEPVIAHLGERRNACLKAEDGGSWCAEAF